MEREGGFDWVFGWMRIRGSSHLLRLHSSERLRRYLHCTYPCDSISSRNMVAHSFPCTTRDFRAERTWHGLGIYGRIHRWMGDQTLGILTIWFRIANIFLKLYIKRPITLGSNQFAIIVYFNVRKTDI